MDDSINRNKSDEYVDVDNNILRIEYNQPAGKINGVSSSKLEENINREFDNITDTK